MIWRLFLVAIIFMPLSAKGSTDTLHVYDNMHIHAGEVLTIDAGTTVYFHGYYHIIVEGSLQAPGTESEPILFTRSDTLGLHLTDIAEGGWNGIRFIKHSEIDTTMVSVFEHCIFEHSKASLLDFESGGAMSINGEHNVVIRNSVFRNNYCYRKGGALYLGGNHALLEYNYFHNNTAYNEIEDNPAEDADGGALFLHESMAEIAWSVFSYNTASGIGGAIVFEESAPLMYNNLVEYNYAAMGGGISFRRSRFSTPLSNNLIINNSSMFFGGGLFFLDSQANILNHTIVGNYSSYGGGVFVITFNNLSDPTFYNSIIRSNIVYPDWENQVFIWDGISAPGFFHCNIEDGLEGFQGGVDFDNIDYKNNIDEDAMFVNEGEHPYALSPGSSSIDSGYEHSDTLGVYMYDLLGNARFSGLRIDIGAYEFQDPHYTVFLSVEGNGYVQPQEGEYFVPEGTELVFEAIPEETWSFYRWETSFGNLDENPITIEVWDDIEIKAVFQPVTITETIHSNSLQNFVYPNPFKDQLFVNIDERFFGDEIMLNLYNSAGVLQQTFRLQTHNSIATHTLDLSELNQGIYFLRMMSEKRTATFKIIKE
ncbi:MAG: T9SS C-terminal target domain-containing protein [Bacteroidia bacterium]|nr:MAG: T9SS C-terminal target domain-containing protein [Bacteroidia bacterium]